MKKVSIITPVYKVEQYIAECVQSVIDQDYDNIEFILVDDCGGDDSINIAEKLLIESTRSGLSYKILRHEGNCGVSAARNTAMLAATGDYIFCLDSDDKLMEQCITVLLAKAVSTGADMVVCNHTSEGKAQTRGGFLNAPVDMINTNRDCIKAFALSWFNVAPWCKLIKRSFIEQHQLFFKMGIINEDAPWTFQLCLNAQSIAFVRQSLYVYRDNESSIMSKERVENINQSNVIALQIFHREIERRDYLWKDINVYNIMMRQIVIYYTMTNEQYGYEGIKEHIFLLDKLHFASPYFSCYSSAIAKYYRLWNLAFLLPNCIRSFYVWTIIRLQKSL
ncbi:glycosyltransferase family 2 protein [Bacteroides xylanisolvens]|jgi:glycosyltransferase involved in cell wall biosynthesis|uniref:glycosyltransferase family 2 protein n=1 Tax=Bacteroides xylanisolvens TaxID=371601 RepID=UPI0022E62DF7|nr:glycosyltransferase family 2 protein [Bacteroides xylanisolvens]